MSTVAKTQGTNTYWVLVKGSPEAIGARLAGGQRPEDYDQRAARLARGGMRVLALGYKRLIGGEGEALRCEDSRAEAEGGLRFAGFVAFSCRVRRDTGAVVRALREGAHDVTMVTGDAVLTAVHVAIQVGITLKDTSTDSPRLPVVILESRGDEGLCWVSYDSGEILGRGRGGHLLCRVTANILAVTGKALARALEEDPGLTKELEHIRVFARMTPDEKERLVLALGDNGKTCLMCGDGANDVGALKQANVGVALLGGFGDINVDRGASGGTGMNIAWANPEDLQRMRVGDLKKKLKEAGVNLAAHTGVVEKKDLINLYLQAKKSHEAGHARGMVGGKGANLNPSPNPQMALAEKRKEAARKRNEEHKAKVIPGT
ncbi:unnamed protein product [Discosporangium mesarthrocarpum]